jgi:hypothetical protein
MSIVRQLIQIGLVEACRNQTIALGDVFDSRMDTLDGLMHGQSRPVLVFSVEESESRREDQTDGLCGRSSRFTVMVQAAVASGQAIRDENNTVVLQAVGETDAAFELRLNILDWQWRAALTRPGNAWADMFRSLMTGIGQIKDQRATDPETGTKHAARFTQFDLDVMPDPIPGDPIPEVIESALALLETDAEYAGTASMWRQILAEDASMNELQRLRAALFSTPTGMLALGADELARSADGGSEDGFLSEAIISIPGVGAIDPVTSDDP